VKALEVLLALGVLQFQPSLLCLLHLRDPDLMVVLEDLEVENLEGLLASEVLVVDSLFQRILLIDDISQMS
jgi:hypothetical protein